MERRRFLLGARSETHTLAMADGFVFNGKKQLEQAEWSVSVALRSETVGKGFARRCEQLDDKKHNNAGLWLMLDKTDQKHNMQRKKQRDSCSVPCEMYAQPFVQVSQRGTRAHLEFSISRNAE